MDAETGVARKPQNGVDSSRTAMGWWLVVGRGRWEVRALAESVPARGMPPSASDVHDVPPPCVLL